MVLMEEDGHIGWSRKFAKGKKKKKKKKKKRQATNGYRPIDTLVSFSKVKGTSLSCANGAPVRYAVRQVLDNEYRTETRRKHHDLTHSKTIIPSTTNGNKKKKDPKAAAHVKRDFFGRFIVESSSSSSPSSSSMADGDAQRQAALRSQRKIYVTFHEGYSNAVRKPISMSELLAGL